MFGSSLSSAPTGSTVKFEPVKGSDTMMRNGITQTIQTKLMCLSAMKPYESKCLEEIRVEDYQANRKQPAAGSTSTGFGSTMGVSSTGSSLFGNKPATGFGGAATTPSFNQPSTGGSLFGSTQNKPAGGLFGSTNTASPFGASTNTNTGTSLFGNKPAFGQQPTNSLFGSANTTATTQQSGFGFGAAKPTTSTGFGSTFGQTNTGTTSLFGQTQAKPLFGATTSQPSGSIFGSTSTQPAQGTSLFGSTATSQPGTTSIFGNTAAQPAAGTSLFGAPAQQNTGTTGSLFGGQQQNTGTTSLFGNTASTGTSLFGNTATQQPAFGGTSAFGAKPAGIGLFGATAQPQQQTTGFTLGGGAAQVAQPQQSVLQVPQQPLLITRDTEQILQQSILESQMSMYPYGTDELFRTISVKSTSEQATEAIKNKLEKERLLNTYTASKAADLSKDKSKPDDGLRKFNQCVLTANKPKVFSYKPLVQKNGLDDSKNESQNSELNDSNGFMSRSMNNKTQSFTELKTGLFIPNVMNSSKSRNDPKKLDTSIFKKDASKLDESVLSRKSILNHSLIPDASIIESPNNDGRGDGVRKEESVFSSTKNNSILAGSTEKQHSPKAVHFSNDQANVSTYSNGHDLSVRSVLSEADENSLNRILREGPCGIRISSRSIYTEPPLEELAQFVENNKVVIPESFKVGRVGYGSVLWEGKFGFSDVDLAKVIQFHRKEVVVYPDDKDKPPVGSELNRPAIICLEKVFPIDRTSKEYITDPNHPEVKRFSSLLEKKCLKMGCSFIDYDPEGGFWSFKVKHFSKYGFYDDDEDEETVVTKPAPLKQKQVEVQTENIVQMEDIDELLEAEPKSSALQLREKFLNFDESMRAPMIDPKRLFISESPDAVDRKRMRFTDDIMEFEELNIESLFGPLNPISFRRIGFMNSKSDDINVTVLKDPRPRSSCVKIETIKLVPTIESYMRLFLDKISKPELFDKLVNTDMLKMNPPSDLIRLVDDYLFKELRLNFSLEEIATKMNGFCEAMCLNPEDIRFSYQQRSGFVKWVVNELSHKLDQKLKELDKQPSSLYAPVYYSLLYGDFKRAIQLARQNGLNDLSMLIGLYSAGTKIPTRLLKCQKMAFEHCKEGSDPYRIRTYALLSHNLKFGRREKTVQLLKDLPILQVLAIQLSYFSSFKDPLSTSVEALPQLVSC
ncbi:unnamed protein product [Bursaphelenchus okinawaensis]|uniref:Nuclear pore complex protein Nup98-Nup96 n=1 Tax=Bursaphelenchus okinawaensis TaxID=465554 RepID=A0A811KXA0_9BILA|nr:unnamed protein product [Bursaphelenchus okinawaensis]CAG9113315.1 unnamed protein product [Bursaphelenchus okinawaensis]